MRRADIIIGCNYGDEGKGLAALSAVLPDARGLNILINGGAQRGHTVEFPDGRRHVFSHFGAAAAAGYTSCADEDFMVNPILFAGERESLINDFLLPSPQLLISSNCRVTTIYDMMVNQLLEDARGKARHGSCGLGIFETRHRYEMMPDAPRYGRLIAMSTDELHAYCRRITDEYIPNRLREVSVDADAAWFDLLRSPGMIDHFREDLEYMKAVTGLYTDFAALCADYDHLIFEAGQGLALDEDNIIDAPHLTPSHTTSLISAKRVLSLREDFETRVIYVTRTYFTRHGAGPLPGECPADHIAPDLIDRTNMPNPYQQTLRYAPFDGTALLTRVQADLTATREILPGIRFALMVTHLNETEYKLAGDPQTVKSLSDHFDELFLSDLPFPQPLEDRN